MAITGKIKHKGMEYGSAYVRISRISDILRIGSQYRITLFYDVYGSESARKESEDNVLERRKITVTLPAPEMEGSQVMEVAYKRLKEYKDDPVIEDVKWKDK